MSWEISRAKGEYAEAIQRGEAKPEKPSAIGRSAPIPAGPGELKRPVVDVRDKIDPQDASLRERVLSQEDTVNQFFESDLKLLQSTADTLKLVEDERSNFPQGEIVDTGTHEELRGKRPRLREEPKWDGTLTDLHDKITALHNVIIREGRRFNETRSQNEKGKIGKFLGHLYEDMDTWIHRFEMWKAEHDIQKAIKKRDQK